MSSWIERYSNATGGALSPKVASHSSRRRGTNVTLPSMIKDGYEQDVITITELRERLAKIQAEEDTLRRLAKAQARSLAAPQVERLIRVLMKGAHAFQRMADPSQRLRVIQRLFAAIYFEKGQITKFSLQSGLIDEKVDACEMNQLAPCASSLRRQCFCPAGAVSSSAAWN